MLCVIIVSASTIWPCLKDRYCEQTKSSPDFADKEISGIRWFYIKSEEEYEMGKRIWVFNPGHA